MTHTKKKRGRPRAHTVQVCLKISAEAAMLLRQEWGHSGRKPGEILSDLIVRAYSDRS